MNTIFDNAHCPDFLRSTAFWKMDVSAIAPLGPLETSSLINAQNSSHNYCYISSSEIFTLQILSQEFLDPLNINPPSINIVPKT
jgi:hypothetical protein